MTTYVYPETIRRMITSEYSLRVFPVWLDVRNSLNFTWTQFGQTQERRVTPAMVGGRAVLRFPGALVFPNMTLSAGITYYLMVSMSFSVSGNTHILQNRLAYSSFSLGESISNNLLRLEFPDNILVRI